MTKTLAKWVAAMMTIVAFMATAPMAEAGSGSQNFPNARIADVALRYVGQSRPTGWNQPGECVKWVQSWVAEAGGSMPGGNPISLYRNGGAVEIPLDQAQRGDIFQISQGDTWNGSPHTGVFTTARQSDNAFDVVAGNIPAGSGTVRTSHYRPSAPAGHELHVWRFGQESAPTVNNPTLRGAFDTIGSPGSGWMSLTGWGFQSDAPSQPLQVHVYDAPYGSHTWGRALMADKSRPDVAAAFPGAGDRHGFDYVLSVPPTTRQACLYLIATSGPSNFLGCRPVSVSGDGVPVGNPEVVQPLGGGQVRVAGWTADGDSPTAPLQVHVYFGGRYGQAFRGVAIMADINRPDVGGIFVDAGPRHGYDSTITGLPPGQYPLCQYFISVGNGPSRETCRTVSVT